MEFILENLGKIGFDWKLGLFNLINFLVLFWILKKLLFKPMVKVINERHNQAKEAVENFKKAQSEVGMAEQKARSIIDDAKKESNELIAKAQDMADKQAEKTREKTRGDVEQIVAQARKNIEIEKNKMHEEVKTEVVAVVISALEKVLGEKIDPKKDKKLIEETLKQVSV